MRRGYLLYKNLETLLFALGVELITASASASCGTEIVRVEGELATLPRYRSGRNWDAGYRFAATKMWEVSACDALITNSVKVVAADGRVLVAGTDYRVEPHWAAIGLIGAAATNAAVNPVTLSYAYLTERLDSWFATADGRIGVRRGTSVAFNPKPPEIPVGATRLSNCWIRGEGRFDHGRVFPVQGAFVAPTPPVPAERAMPRTLAKLRRGERVRVLAWGDSVTEAAYLPDDDRWQTRIAAYLRAKFPAAQVDLATCAWSAHNLRDFLSAPTNSPHNYAEKVLSSGADLVISEFVNDSRFSTAEVKNLYGRVLGDFRARGIEWVILTPHYMTPSWCGLRGCTDCDEDPREYVKAIRDFASERGVGLADAAARWGHLWREGIPFATLLANGVNHPDREGMGLFVAAFRVFLEAKPRTLPPENAFVGFTDGTFASEEGFANDLALVDKLADAGYDVLTLTLRCRYDLNSSEAKDAARRLFAKAHARGLKVCMDTDPRRARDGYLQKHPDQLQGVLRFGVAAATNGAARVEIVQPAINDHMSWCARPYESVSAAFVKAWAIRTAADGSVTARPVAARAMDVRADRLTVTAEGLASDESLAALVRFDLWSIDVFSPGFLAYERALMATYRTLGADGGMRDEWGFPPSGIPGQRECRTFWYSQNYADAYAKATGGRDLADDALLFAFPLAGRANERSLAVRAYMRLNWERNTAIERDFYETDKRLFGLDAYVCKHPTWYPVVGWKEFLHNGLDWWSAPRDWAQTDETTPVPAACGMAKKCGGAVWLNEGYQNEPDRYARMVWRYALAGGRMVFHPVYPANGERYAKMKPDEAKVARHLDIVTSSKRARDCVRLLSRISSAPIDCPVAYVFGHERVAWDWTDTAWGDWGDREVYSLWERGWGVDLYPSTEFATFQIGADGWLTMGRQRYAALVTHHLSGQDRAQLKALLAKGVTKTRVFETSDGVAEYLTSMPGLARQTPFDLSGGIGEWTAVLPPPDGTVALTDGTRARIRAVRSLEGDPIEGVLELADGRRYEYAARGLFAANAEFVAAAGATRIKGPGVDFASSEPRDVVLPLASIPPPRHVEATR